MKLKLLHQYQLFSIGNMDKTPLLEMPEDSTVSTQEKLL